MRYRSLGRSGIRVSEIGFGAWGIGGDADGAVAYGPADREESLAALRRALGCGITFFDTSDLYGYGRSETLIGEALASRRAEAVIASKVGMLDATGRQDFSAAHVLRSFDATLARLGTDYLDLYQLHSPPAELLPGDGGPLRELRELRDQGRVRAIGVSVRSPEDGMVAVRHPAVDCIQVNFNLLDQRALALGLFDACAGEGVGVIVRTPLCFGFLTGKYSAGQAYGASDHRSRWSAEQRQRWASGPAIFERWRSAQAETAAQFALRYCLSFEAVSTAIPGMLTEAHVEENSAAAALEALPAPALAEILERYRGQDFFVRAKRDGNGA